jgi:hypothetical protein
VEVSLDILFDGQLRADINHQYFPRDISSLREKLEQYPSGTTSRLTILGNEDRLQPVVRVVNEAAVEGGLTVEVAH